MDITTVNQPLNGNHTGDDAAGDNETDDREITEGSTLKLKALKRIDTRVCGMCGKVLKHPEQAWRPWR